MATVSFITFCHPYHLPMLHKPGVLRTMVESHQHPFSEVIVVHQRCRGLEYQPLDYPARIVESEDYYPQIFSEYGIKWPDPVLEELTHGPTSAHFWENHTMNHLIGLKEAKGDFIVFSDCDSKIIASDPRMSWVAKGIQILKGRRNIFCVSPSDGGGERAIQIMSQQMFMVETIRMRSEPIGMEWDGTFMPGGPFQEYYGMMEGRIGRVLTTKGYYRYVLPDKWRYWHTKDWVSLD